MIGAPITLPTRWLAVSLLNGKILCDLPGVVATNPARRTMNSVETQDVQFFVDQNTNPDWDFATEGKTSALIAYIEVGGKPIIQWGGIITKKVVDSSNGLNMATLSLATLEAYLDDRYTGAYTTDPSGVGATVDQNVIAQILVNNFVVANQGIPFNAQIVGAAGSPRFEQYNDFDDKTVLSNLQTLAGLYQGIQFTAWWSWNPDNTITPTFTVGSRIGKAATAGLAPSVTFDNSMLTQFSVSKDWSKGQGANDVMAVGNGQGLSRPTGEIVGASFGNRPRVQYRYNPTTSIWDPQTMTQHAQGAFALLANGTTIVTLKAPMNSGPMFGVDWDLGDDIGYQLSGPAVPRGISGVGQVFAYETDHSTYMSPILRVLTPI